MKVACTTKGEWTTNLLNRLTDKFGHGFLLNIWTCFEVVLFVSSMCIMYNLKQPKCNAVPLAKHRIVYQPKFIYTTHIKQYHSVREFDSLEELCYKVKPSEYWIQNENPVHWLRIYCFHYFWYLQFAFNEYFSWKLREDYWIHFVFEA